MARFLTSPETGYPIRGLVHLLRTAHETRPRQALPDLGLQKVHEHCTQTLGTRLPMPAREKDDWSMSAPGRCRCRLCGMLDRFLGARDQVRFEWPLAKDQRAHIHQVIDAHDLSGVLASRQGEQPHSRDELVGDHIHCYMLLPRHLEDPAVGQRGIHPSCGLVKERGAVATQQQ
jgi:hypothetical protein